MKTAVLRSSQYIRSDDGEWKLMPTTVNFVESGEKIQFDTSDSAIEHLELLGYRRQFCSSQASAGTTMFFMTNQ